MIANLVIKANHRILAATASNCCSLVGSQSINKQQTNHYVTTNRNLATKSNDYTKQVPDLTLPATSSQQQTDITKHKQEHEGLEEYQPKTDRALLYPEQMEWLDERLVRISRPSKNVMQSGTAYTNTWKIEFDSKERWEYWLMGWTSSKDPVSNLTLNFPTKEDAIAFCDKNKLQWYVEEQPERKIRRKSYADNFSWNKRTRLGNK